MPVDPNQLSQDKDFLAAQPADQIKYLSAQDPDFAKAQPSDQYGYLSHLTGKQLSAPTPMPNAGLAPPAGAPPKSLNSGEGPIASGLTSMETQLSKMPGQMASLVKQSWMDKPRQDQPTTADQLLDPKNLNPIVRERASLSPEEQIKAAAKNASNPIDYGATAANLLPWAVDPAGGGITKSPLGSAAGLVKDAASATGNVVKGAAKASGVGLSPIEKLTKAAGPSVRDANFPQSLETASPEIARQNAATPIKSVQGMADAAHNAADSLWTNQIEPQITRNAAATIDGRQIAKGIRSGIDEGMTDLFPDQAKAANSFADKFENPNLPLSKANSYLKTLNAQLKGFYKMSPEGRAAAGVTDGRISAIESAAEGLRQQMYDKLDSLGETDPAGLRQQYGALKQVQDVFRKRAIVSGRQAPLNLPQLVAIAGGAGEGASALLNGHPAAALAGTAPIAVTSLLKYFNSPDSLVSRGVSGLDVPPAIPETLKPPPVAPSPGVPKSLGAAAAQPPVAEVPTSLRDIISGIRDPKIADVENAQRGHAAEMAQKHPAQSISPLRDPFSAPTRKPSLVPNGSGESSASAEAIGRSASEKAAGTKRVVVDTRSGAERPLIGADAVDYRPKDYESVEFRGGKRDGEIIDQGPKARPYGRKRD